MVSDVSRYHSDLRTLLETDEPELWDWFAEAAHPDPERVDAATVELLKSAYRLDGTAHDTLTAEATLLARELDIDAPVWLYQELGTDQRNARVQLLGGEVHIVFSGELLDMVAPNEARAVLAHELAHADLWTRDDRAWWVLDHMVHRLADGARSPDALTETARRLRLHTEVWADRQAVAATGDQRSVVSALVKVNAGLRTVDPDSYLEQAREILAADPAVSEGWSHPELHIRVACLAARTQPGGDDAIAALIEGPDDLERLDLLGQARLRQISADTLRTALDAVPAVAGVRASMLDLYADLPDGEPVNGSGFADHQPSIRHLAASLLVDVALAEPDHADAIDDLRALAATADRLGVGTEFDRILGEATHRSAAVLERLRSNA